MKKTADLIVDSETLPVQVVSISLGGFQILSPVELIDEGPLRLRFTEETRTFSARLVRCFARGKEEYICGFTVDLSDADEAKAWEEVVSTAQES